MDAVARGLIWARFLRSMAQGALVVDFVLYLKALGWGATGIGLLLGASGFVGAALLLAGGMLSDRFGRRPFLMGYQLALAVGALAVVLSPHSWVLVLAALLLSYGRGANGSAGPFAPVEQAWLAARVGQRARSQVFSLNAGVGFFGMGLGTIFGSAVPLFARLLPGPSAYEPLFVLNFVIALLSTVIIARLRESPRPGAQDADEEADGAPVLPESQRLASGAASPGGPAADAALGPTGAISGAAGADRGRPASSERRRSAAGRARAQASAPAGVQRRENVALTLWTTINSVNAVGIGLIGPLLPYWFAVRFGAGPGAIGSVYALTFLLAALSSVLTGEMGARVGVTRSIVMPRTVGVVTLVAMPLMPAYAWAAGLYAVRAILNRGTAGARQAFSMGLVRDQRRGLAGSLSALSFRLPSAAGSAVGGWLMGMGLLALPFFISSGLQLAYVLLFGLVLKRYENGT